jgi:hypothetical protein
MVAMAPPDIVDAKLARYGRPNPARDFHDTVATSGRQ